MLDGHHGIPDRTFRMNHLNVLEICIRVTATVRTGGWIGGGYVSDVVRWVAQ